MTSQFAICLCNYPKIIGNTKYAKKCKKRDFSENFIIQKNVKMQIFKLLDNATKSKLCSLHISPLVPLGGRVAKSQNCCGGHKYFSAMQPVMRIRFCDGRGTKKFPGCTFYTSGADLVSQMCPHGWCVTIRLHSFPFLLQNCGTSI